MLFLSSSSPFSFLSSVLPLLGLLFLSLVSPSHAGALLHHHHTHRGAIANETCNGHVELCSRRYSNVSMVGAHNSPFTFTRNLAANQALPVTQQLDDGVRFVQAQIQWPAHGSEPHFCHTSCDLLDAGPITDWLGEVRQWVDAHPRDVVTVLLGNGNYSTPDRYAPHIEAAGLLRYAYVPETPAMAPDDWPTLGAMLARGQRVVLLLDYKADPAAFPWLLDEFAYLWETPMDPVVQVIDDGGGASRGNGRDGSSKTVVPASTLPCTAQRPPGLADGDARSRLYLMNHNVNVELSLLGFSLLVPAVSLSNQTNAATGTNSLGAAADACVAAWGRPPLVLNVDYYNKGSPPGSVFEVAARLNGVPYFNNCCGKTATPMLVSGGGRGSSGRGESKMLSLAAVTSAVAAVAVSIWLW